MADGINIKTLPAATSMLGSDRILIDRNVTGTLVIPFSAISVDGSQVTFYTDFIDLSGYAYALSASTNNSFIGVYTNIANLSTNIVSLSTNIFQVSSNVVRLSSDVRSLSTNIIQLSANVVNRSTFLSGGVSPSGILIPDKVGVFYLTADTKDVFVSVGTSNNKDWKKILTLGY
jgi:hypothetical protein